MGQTFFLLLCVTANTYIAVTMGQKFIVVITVNDLFYNLHKPIN